MAEEIMVLTKEELQEKPEVIGESIAQLAQAIVDTKGDIEIIKGRGFWKRLTNNNTRDLAEAMMKQNDTISGFLTIVQGVIFLSMNNVVVLGGIMDALNKQEDANNLRDNQYFNMAKDYLSEAIKSAKKIQANEEEIKKIKAKIVETYIVQENQRKQLEKLHAGFDELSSSSEQQAQQLAHLHEKVKEQRNENERQKDINEQLLRNLEEKERLIAQQSEKITVLSKTNDEQRKQMETLNTQLETWKKQQDRILAELTHVSDSQHQQLSKLENANASLKAQLTQFETRLHSTRKLLLGVSIFALLALVFAVVQMFM